MDSISELKYPYPEGLRLFDPSVSHPEDADLKQALKHARHDQPQRFFYLPILSLAIHDGFKNVSYLSHNLPDGRFFAMTVDRCEAFGKSISRDLQFLGLELTCFMQGTAQFIEKGIEQNKRDGELPRVYELLFAHKSGDEVTAEEAIAFARIIHILNVRVAHLWAGEFEPNALDALYETLQQLNNQSLSLADICDVSIPEPDDRIFHSGLELLVQQNLERNGPVSSLMATQ